MYDDGYMYIQVSATGKPPSLLLAALFPDQSHREAELELSGLYCISLQLFGRLLPSLWELRLDSLQLTKGSKLSPTSKMSSKESSRRASMHHASGTFSHTSHSPQSVRSRGRSDADGDFPGGRPSSFLQSLAQAAREAAAKATNQPIPSPGADNTEEGLLADGSTNVSLDGYIMLSVPSPSENPSTAVARRRQQLARLRPRSRKPSNQHLPGSRVSQVTNTNNLHANVESSKRKSWGRPSYQALLPSWAYEQIPSGVSSDSDSDAEASNEGGQVKWKDHEALGLPGHRSLAQIMVASVLDGKLVQQLRYQLAVNLHPGAGYDIYLGIEYYLDMTTSLSHSLTLSLSHSVVNIHTYIYSLYLPYPLVVLCVTLHLGCLIESATVRSKSEHSLLKGGSQVELVLKELAFEGALRLQVYVCL